MLSNLRGNVVVMQLLIVAAVCLHLPTQLMSQAGTQEQGGLPLGEQQNKTQSIEDMFKNVPRAKAERNLLESSGGAAGGTLNRGTLPVIRRSDGNEFPSRFTFPRQAFPQNSLRFPPRGAESLRGAEPLSVTSLTASPLGLSQSVGGSSLRRVSE